MSTKNDRRETVDFIATSGLKDGMFQSRRQKDFWLAASESLGGRDLISGQSRQSFGKI